MFDPGFTCSHIRGENPSSSLCLSLMCCPWSVVLLLFLLYCWLVLFSMREQKPVPQLLYLPHSGCPFPPKKQSCPLSARLKFYTTPWFPLSAISWNLPRTIGHKLSGIKGIPWRFLMVAFRGVTTVILVFIIVHLSNYNRNKYKIMKNAHPKWFLQIAYCVRLNSQ